MEVAVTNLSDDLLCIVGNSLFITHPELTDIVLLRRDAAVAANITVTDRDNTDKDARTQPTADPRNAETKVSSVFNEPMQSANLQRVMTRADHNADREN